MAFGETAVSLFLKVSMDMYDTVQYVMQEQQEQLHMADGFSLSKVLVHRPGPVRLWTRDSYSREELYTNISCLYSLALQHCLVTLWRR